MIPTKSLALFFASLTAAAAFAADTTTNLQTIAQSAETFVANGDVSKVKAFDASKYDEYEEQKRILQDFIDIGGCANGGIKPRASIEGNLKFWNRVNFENAGKDEGMRADAMKISSALSDLKKTKNLTALLSVSWDEVEEAGESADGVACSKYLFRVFTADGKILTVYYDITD